MRSDGDALLNDFQRPAVSRRGDIGAWNSVMNTISYLAVISNSFIIGFTSAAAFELLVDDGLLHTCQQGGDEESRRKWSG